MADSFGPTGQREQHGRLSVVAGLAAGYVSQFAHAFGTSAPEVLALLKELRIEPFVYVENPASVESSCLCVTREQYLRLRAAVTLDAGTAEAA